MSIRRVSKIKELVIFLTSSHNYITITSVKQKHSSSLVNLEEQHKSYQEELNKVAEQQKSLKNLLSELNILKEEENKKVAAEEEERREKLQELLARKKSEDSKSIREEEKEKEEEQEPQCEPPRKGR